VLADAVAVEEGEPGGPQVICGVGVLPGDSRMRDALAAQAPRTAHSRAGAALTMIRRLTGRAQPLPPAD
jgi:hypothetical protein